MTGRRGDGPPGQVGELDGRRVLEIVGEAAEAGAEDDADARDEVRAGPDGGDERGQPGGLLGRGDREGPVDGVTAHGPSIRAAGRGPLNFDARWEY